MVAAACCYLLITALLFRNLLPVLKTHLFGDLGDPLLNTAIVEWNARHLPLTADWWNFPSFAPLSGVTAFTEHLLGAYPLTSPVIWITGNPVLAYNVLSLASIVLNGIAACALVRALTGSRAGGFIGGLAFAFAPFVGEQATHVQMLMAFAMPWALLQMHRYLTHGRPRDLVWLGVAWLEALLSSSYMLIFFPMLVALWTVWFFRRADARRWARIAATLVVATLPVVPVLIGYHTRQQAYGLVRGVDEINAMSATFASIAGISQRATLWKGWLPDMFYEASLFPGVAIALLALIGAAMTRQRRVVFFYLAGAVAMWLLTLGPARGPYALLLKLPGAQSIRVPARAWLVATLCLAVCAGFGAAWLAARTRTKWLVPLFGLLIVAEGWFAGPAMEVPMPLPLYLAPGTLVLDLPLSPDYGNADPQYLAVLGDYRVVNGYSGYAPPHFSALRTALDDHTPQAFIPFRQRADLYVVSRPGVEPQLVAWLETLPDIERLTDFGKLKLYRLPRLGSGPPLPLLVPLPKPGEVALSIPGH